MGFALRRRIPGFTLFELLVAIAVLILMLALILPIVSNVTRISSSSSPTFQEARTAFETMTRLLSQAVLNTYWDYDDARSPRHYVRASELHFVLGPAPALTGLPDTQGSAVFFQAPLGQDENIRMVGLLNSVGFYLAFSCSEHLPSYLSSRKPSTAAWRLWMFLQPSQDFSLYDSYNAAPQALSEKSWFRNGLQEPSRNHVLANNAVLLLLRVTYVDLQGNVVERYAYDSRPASTGSGQAVETHQIPPLIHATLVVIDQQTANRLLSATNNAPYDLIASDLFLDARQYSSDMARLLAHLDSRPIAGIPIHYRVFETTISMNSSQWSRH